MRELATDFPQGVSQIIPFDTTRFVQASIHEVINTLLDAAALVLLVVFVFLQNWRATLIPIIAVPVSLIGAFAGLLLFGFSINTLTLFAIVLATGIVVDDAIVVLENVERLMAERKLSPQEAADRVDARGDRRDHRDRARADLGVHPGRVPRRPRRQALPAVRRDGRHRGRDLRSRRADADAGAVRAAAEAAARGESRCSGRSTAASRG